MSPYRSRSPESFHADAADVAAFANAHRQVRLRALGGGAAFAACLFAMLFFYAWWFYFGHHCGFACM